MARRRGAGPSVYFEVDGPPYAAGPASFIGELLTLLGARNIVTPDLGPFPQLNPEYVVRHDPDVIFVSHAELAHRRRAPGLGSDPRRAEQRVCSFPPTVRDSIVRPGPRVAEGMQRHRGLSRAGIAVNVCGPRWRSLAAARVGGRAARRFGMWLLCCVAITLLLSFGGLSLAPAVSGPRWSWLLSPDAQSSVVLWQIRLPRTVGAWCAGALLGLAGAIAQGVFRNPLGGAVPAGNRLRRRARRDDLPDGRGCLHRRACLGRQFGHHRRGLHRRLRRDAAHDHALARCIADREPVALGHRDRLLAERRHLAPAARQAGDLARDADLSAWALPPSSAGRPRACSPSCSASASCRRCCSRAGSTR